MIAHDAELLLPGAPAIDGLRFRRYGGPDDLPGMVEVANAASAANGLLERVTVTQVAWEYAHLTQSDPLRDAILAQVDGRTVAYSRVDRQVDADGSRTWACFGLVHPAWRRRGIGSAMAAWNLRHIDVLAASDAFAGQRWLVSWEWGDDPGARALLAGMGLEPVRESHVMLRPDLDDLVPPALPAGIEVRPLDPQTSRAFWEAMVESFQDHHGGADTSETAWTRWVGDADLDPSMCLVALDGTAVAGGIVSSVEPGVDGLPGSRRGWAESLFTRKPWRRHGLAEALFVRALCVLRDRGLTAARLGVDAQNPFGAMRLYERHGFRVSSTTVEWRRPLDRPRTDP